MANKRIEQNIITVSAAENFGKWLKESMKKEHLSCERLAKIIGVERKSILNYINGKTSPRLDVVAMLFAYFDENEITIKIK